MERLTQEEVLLLSQLEGSLNQLQKDISAYAVGNISLENLEQIEDHLQARRDQWILRKKTWSEIDRQIAVLDTQTRHQVELIQEIRYGDWKTEGTA